MLGVIIDRLIPEIPKLISHQQGICIVNKLVQTAMEPRHINYLIDYLTSNIFEVISNPYGNYAITTALDVSIHLLCRRYIIFYF